jgi:5-methylcytosine-specific restriction enzyme subunit McrC
MIAAADPIELELREFEPERYSSAELPYEVAYRIWQQYPTQIAVEFPSPKTDGQYELTNRGWVGVVPLGRDAVISLEPKVPLANVFRMLEYAYRLDAFGTSEDTAGVETMREVYESLARVLARRVRDRARKGLHRSYQGREERLSVVRGRLNLETPGGAPGEREAALPVRGAHSRPHRQPAALRRPRPHPPVRHLWP